LCSGIKTSPDLGFSAERAAVTIAALLTAAELTVGGNTAIRKGRADTLSNWKAYAAADAYERDHLNQH
jgi:hypothetical protein